MKRDRKEREENGGKVGNVLERVSETDHKADGAQHDKPAARISPQRILLSSMKLCSMSASDRPGCRGGFGGIGT